MAIYSGIFLSIMTRAMKNSGKEYPELVDDLSMQDQAALFAMVLRGVGDVVGSNLIGQIRDRVGTKTAILILILFLAMALALLLSFNYINKWSYVHAYSMCLMWGMQYSGINTLMGFTLGFEFDDKTAPFAVMKFMQSLFCFVFNLVDIPIMNHDGLTTD